MAILIVVMTSIAQLFASSVRANTSARAIAVGAVLADRKLEELRTAAWGDEALAPSAPGTLTTDSAGYVDYCDRTGNVVGSASSSPGALYVRRWSISPVANGPPNELVIAVSVAPAGTVVSLDRVAPNEARVVTIRTNLP